MIKTKNTQLKETEEQYEQKLKELAGQYEVESKKKGDLEGQLRQVKQELEDIET
jgi:hypothetical protein